MLKTLTKALYRFIVYSGGKIPDFVDVHASCKRNGFILRKRIIHARNSRITCVQKRCFAFSVGSISAAFSSPVYVPPRVRSAGSFLGSNNGWPAFSARSTAKLTRGQGDFDITRTFQSRELEPINNEMTTLYSTQWVT